MKKISGNHFKRVIVTRLNLENLFPKEAFVNINFSLNFLFIHETIFSNVIDFLLHHTTHAKSAKKTWDNFYETFEK